MADYPAMPLWTDAYLADTRHLTTEEHGAYLLLLMEAWRRPNCSLPDNDVILARLAGLSVDRWQEMKPVIMDLWDHDGRSKTWMQKRQKKERDFLARQSQLQRDRVAKRWNKTKKDDTAVIPDGYRGNTPTPTPIPKRKKDTSYPKKDAEKVGSEHPSEETNTHSKNKTGTRLEEGWVLPKSWGEWARSEQSLTDHEIRTQAETFRDYWISVPGQKGRKLDWEATWRNWIRRYSENRANTHSKRGANTHSMDVVSRAQMLANSIRDRD